MINRAQYVKKLEEMLQTEKPCSTCPGFNGFWDYRNDFRHDDQRFYKGWDRNDGNMNHSICFKLCRPFIGLSDDKDAYPQHCPCQILGEEEALKRAHVAVDEYRAGTYPWKRGDKK